MATYCSKQGCVVGIISPIFPSSLAVSRKINDKYNRKASTKTKRRYLLLEAILQVSCAWVGLETLTLIFWGGSKRSSSKMQPNDRYTKRVWKQEIGVARKKIIGPQAKSVTQLINEVFANFFQRFSSIVHYS